MKKVTVHLVRHGQTVYNHADVVQGWGDSFLTPKGIQDTRAVGKQWAKDAKTFDAIYSSDSGRTQQTARVLLDAMGDSEQKINLRENFREYNFGAYEGQSNQAAFDRYFEHMGLSEHPTFTNTHLKNYFDAIAEVDKKDRGHLDNVYLSEPYETYIKRLKSGVEEVVAIAMEENHEDVLIVSHGLTIQAIYSHYFLSDDHPVELPQMPNVGLTSFNWYEDGHLELIGHGVDVAKGE